IGYTKLGLTTKITEGIARYDLSQTLRKFRVLGADQSVRNTVTPITEAWAAEGALKRLTKRVPQPASLRDMPRSYEQMLPYVNEMKIALLDITIIMDKDSSHQMETIKAASGQLIEKVSWYLMFQSIDAHEGNPGVFPWSTSFYLRKYQTWQARWDHMVTLFRTSKAAVCNLLLCPHATGFACDPESELTRKVVNKKTNNNKA
ncbi:hypothetical protein B0T20DRAFT_339520, partial [Sordaria brevicollis]